MMKSYSFCESSSCMRCAVWSFYSDMLLGGLCIKTRNCTNCLKKVALHLITTAVWLCRLSYISASQTFLSATQIWVWWTSRDARLKQYLFIYLTTILLQAVAWLVQPCRVTSSVENTTQEKLKTKRKCKNQYTALLASNTALQERINSIEYSIWKGGRRIRHII